jgi:hypothetical protein
MNINIYIVTSYFNISIISDRCDSIVIEINSIMNETILLEVFCYVK